MEIITKRPLVFIIQEITNKEIAKKNNDYIYLDSKVVIENEILEEAIQKQDEYYFEDNKVEMNKAIQTMLDNKAKDFGYDNIMSCRSYAGYANQYQEEATKLATWCSEVWVKAGEIAEDVATGNREMPTIDELLDELPKYE